MRGNPKIELIKQIAMVATIVLLAFGAKPDEGSQGVRHQRAHAAQQVARVSSGVGGSPGIVRIGARQVLPRRENSAAPFGATVRDRAQTGGRR